MPHRLKIENKGTYLYVRVTGDNTAQDVEDYLTKVGAACLAYQCSRVLVVENLAGESLPASTILPLVQQGARNARAHVEAMAFVDVNHKHDHSALEFAVGVAKKNGLNIRLFKTVVEARKWIEEVD